MRCLSVNNLKKIIDITPDDALFYDLTNLPNEEWKDIKGYEKLYQVSNYGRIKSLERTTTKTHILKCYFTKRGYCRICLYRDGIKRNFFVHSLVMINFGKNLYDDSLQINHLNENKKCNHISNLEWCNNIYNIRYGTGIERSKVKKYKSVAQYTNDGRFMKNYKSIQDASVAVSKNHNKSGVRRISKCAKNQLSLYRGFKWKFIIDGGDE